MRSMGSKTERGSQTSISHRPLVLCPEQTVVREEQETSSGPASPAALPSGGAIPPHSPHAPALGGGEGAILLITVVSRPFSFPPA